jgi:hypothetical protein
MTSYRGGQSQASADKSDKTVRYFIWLLFDASSLASKFKLNEPAQFAGLVHRMINVGFSIDDGDEGLEDDEDLTPWKEVDGVADEASNMEEVETSVYVGAQTLQAAPVGPVKFIIISSGLAAPG